MDGAARCTDRCPDRRVAKHASLAEAQQDCARGAVVTCVAKGRGLETAYFCDPGAQAPCLVVTHDQVHTSRRSWVLEATSPSF